MAPQFTFTATIWMYGGKASWYFITLPQDISNEIKSIAATTPKRGFGSVKVTATINDQTWSTSIFPDTKQGAYLLPIKQSVRKACGLEDGSALTCSVKLTDF